MFLQNVLISVSCCMLLRLKSLRGRTFGTLLQGASADDGGSEEPIGNGLHAGHAYSINQVRKTSEGEVLVQCRNPWGQCEWTGAWCDKDPRWTPALKKELGQADREDGMFWMSIDDFAKSFTTITFCDLVPSSFTVLRAEGEWTRQNGGGCANHKSWKLNPQLLMKVTQKSHITISLNQPDSRMQFRTGEKTKADFDELYGYGTGYEEHIGFTVFKGSQRKVAYTSRDKVAEAPYSSVRTVSVCIPECAPGDYIIVPTTFDPCMMKFRMRFWSNNPIELVDTKGGSEWQLFDARDDALGQQSAPIPMARALVEEERAPPPLPGVAPNAPQNVIPKFSREHAQTAGMLSGEMMQVAKASWKVGDLVPEKWQHGQDFVMAPGNRFVPGEICTVMRPDRSVRFAKISRDNGNNTYDLCTGIAASGGLMLKAGVPAEFICKLPHDRTSHGTYPTALIQQVGTLFDLLDVDGSGSLDFHFDGKFQGEMASDLGRRFLLECNVDVEDMDATYKAMKQLDRNGDGVVDRGEFVDWCVSCLLASDPTKISQPQFFLTPFSFVLQDVRTFGHAVHAHDAHAQRPWFCCYLMTASRRACSELASLRRRPGRPARCAMTAERKAALLIWRGRGRAGGRGYLLAGRGASPAFRGKLDSSAWRGLAFFYEIISDYIPYQMIPCPIFPMS